MARVNKTLLRKAKLKLKQQQKSEDAKIAERAQGILSRRTNRQIERKATVRDADFEKPVTKVGWNFATGELVQIRKRNQGRYGADDSCYLVIGAHDLSWGDREETNSRLEITGPAGILIINAAHLRKV